MYLKRCPPQQLVCHTPWDSLWLQQCQQCQPAVICGGHPQQLGRLQSQFLDFWSSRLQSQHLDLMWKLISCQQLMVHHPQGTLHLLIHLLVHL